MSWQDFAAPVLLSAKVSIVSSIIVFIIGIAAARAMSRARFKGKLLLETAFMLPLVLPPTVIGFLLLVAFGRRSWFGKWIEWVTGAPVVFTWSAAVIAAVVVAFPLVYQTVKTGFLSVDKELEEVTRSIGGNEWQVFRYITLPLSARFLMTGFVLGFARSLGEFGATLMIAGNIPGVTQTVPTAIYIAVDSGRMALAACWAAFVVLISFVMMYFVRARGQ